MESKKDILKKKHRKVRKKIAGTAERPRLCVAKSNKHIYAEIVNDDLGLTLAAASDLKLKQPAGEFPQVTMAKEVGQELAKRALAKKITRVVFDRGGYLYTGLVKALAEGAREGGLQF